MGMRWRIFKGWQTCDLRVSVWECPEIQIITKALKQGVARAIPSPPAPLPGVPGRGEPMSGRLLLALLGCCNFVLVGCDPSGGRVSVPTLKPEAMAQAALVEH